VQFDAVHFGVGAALPQKDLNSAIWFFAEGTRESRFSKANPVF
jgi:hypothetical protein